MRFNAALNPFAEAASAAARIADEKSPIPILSHVKIVAEGDEVRITASNLDREIELRFAAQVSEPGATTVPGKKLDGALRTSAKGADVYFETNDKGAILRTGRPRFT